MAWRKVVSSGGGVLILAMAWGGPAHARQALLAGNAQTQTLDCAGDEAVLRGNDNRLALRGRCRSVLVEGNDNRISAAVASGAPIRIRGNGNQLRYRAAGGGPARVNVAGMDNLVTRGDGVPQTPVPPPDAPDQTRLFGGSEAPLALREENMRRSVDCTGRDVLVEGNGNEYTLQGGCRSLTVRGEGVVIHAEMRPGSQISLQGNGDVVTWLLSAPGSDPTTVIDGEGSRISEAGHAMSRDAPAGVSGAISGGSSGGAAPPRPGKRIVSEPATPPVSAPPPVPPAPPPQLGRVLRPGPLTVRGDHEARDLDCGGRDVKIDASYGIFVLRGECHSLSVKGDSNKVQAELAPGAAITIKGQGSTVAYAVAGDGPNAVVSVQGNASRAWRVPALGAASPPPPPPPPPSPTGPTLSGKDVTRP